MRSDGTGDHVCCDRTGLEPAVSGPVIGGKDVAITGAGFSRTERSLRSAGRHRSIVQCHDDHRDGAASRRRPGPCRSSSRTPTVRPPASDGRSPTRSPAAVGAPSVAAADAGPRAGHRRHRDHASPAPTSRRRDRHCRRRSGDRRPGVEQHPDCGGHAGRRGGLGQCHRHDGDRCCGDRNLPVRAAGGADPHVRRTDNDGDADASPTPGRRSSASTPADGTDGGATTATATAAPTPRSAPSSRIRAGSTRATWPRARPGSFFDTRVVVGQPRRDAGPRAVPVPDRPGPGRAALPGHSGDVAADHRPATAVRSRVGQHLDRHRVGRPGRRRSHDALGSGDARRRARRVELAGAVAERGTWPRARRTASFDLFYLLQNPSQTQSAQVRIRYLLPAGAPIEQ